MRFSRELTLSAWGLLHATSVAPRRLRFEDKLPHGTVLVLGPAPDMQRDRSETGARQTDIQTDIQTDRQTDR
eukprot:COSAG03_NODE_12261_length_553_cov_0.563596_2_plen_71_part_01